MEESFDIEDKMHFDASLARGKVLNEVAMLEKLIDVYLSMYYAQKGKQNSFMLTFLSKTELRRKVNIFKETIQLYKNNFVVNYPEYESDLERIFQSRNIFAHEVLDVTQEGLIKYSEGVLRFDNFKKNRLVTSFTKEQIEQEVDLISKYIIGIRELLDD